VTPDEALDLIYSVVASIPRGRVATYGQVAALAGLARRARLVGHALRETPDGVDVPWHRVVNHQGRISARDEPASEHNQRRLLEAEGVRFIGDRVDMESHQWDE